jgi:hypothetical protein
VLGAVVLALHDDAGGNMRQAHRRVGLVDVLTAGARGAVGVGAHVGRVDGDVDAVVDFREDEDAGERGMPARIRIVGRFAHQAVDADLGAQEAVGVLAFDAYGGALDAGDLTFGFFQQFGLEALALAIAQVHALQHAGPILGLGAAGAGIDFDEAGRRIHRIGEHAPEFQIGHLGLDPGDIAGDRQQGVVVVFRLGHVEQFAGVGEFGIDVFQGQDDVLKRFALLAYLQGALVVVPERRVFGDAGDFVETVAFAVVVKDTPVVPGRGGPDRRGWLESG